MAVSKENFVTEHRRLARTPRGKAVAGIWLVIPTACRIFADSISDVEDGRFKNDDNVFGGDDEGAISSKDEHRFFCAFRW